MKCKIMFLVWCGVILMSLNSEAQRRRSGESRSSSPTLSYDLSAGAGSYENQSYTEINLGLNWYLKQWLIWRNALFGRFTTGEETVTGLDSSLRLASSQRSEGGDFGLDFFAGPGLRFANQNSNALFGEAGLAFKLAGIYLGVGMKSLYYTSTRKDSQGRELSKNDNQIFIILSGGGTL